MENFSKRFGFSEEPHLQIDTISVRLQTVLWNKIALILKERIAWYSGSFDESFINILAINFAIDIDRFPVNIMWEYSGDSNISFIKKIIFWREWYVIYDFIEFLLKYLQKIGINYDYSPTLNFLLEQENSGYRLWNDGLFISITNEQELWEIDTAKNTKYNTVNTHIKQASSLLSDRKNPDYRNSIKESISAVECLMNIINWTDSDTFWKAVKKLEKTGINIPTVLQEWFDKIYGYSSNKQSGIRHFLTDESVDIGFEDAQFMLVSCSAFVNYLVAKNEKIL